jgi:RimJ/RimL family protein N-acetyltransferase
MEAPNFRKEAFVIRCPNPLFHRSPREKIIVVAGTFPPWVRMKEWPDLPIRTKRLVLRPLLESDAGDIAGCIGSKDIVMYTLMIPFPYTLDDATRFIKDSRKAFEEGSALNLAIVPDDIGKASGVVGLMGFEPMYRKASVGYWLSRGLWGKGYVPEALRVLAHYAFGPLGLHRLEAHIFEPNTRSRRVLEKAHFRYEGLLRDRYFKDGMSYNALMYSRLSTDSTCGP